jgi:toxin ParE1/3/4
MPRVIRSPQAERDTLQIWTRIAQDDVAAADDLTDSFTAALEVLAQFPGVGRARDELRPGLRSFPVRKYLLLYKKVPGGIEVVRVIHGARDLRRIFRKR